MQKGWLLVIGEENTLLVTCKSTELHSTACDQIKQTKHQSLTFIRTTLYSWHVNDRQAGENKINNRLSHKQISFGPLKLFFIIKSLQPIFKIRTENLKPSNNTIKHWTGNKMTIKCQKIVNRNKILEILKTIPNVFWCCS